MAILRSLLVNLGMNSSRYRTDLDSTKNKTKKDFKEMKDSADKNVGSIVKSFGTLASGVGAGIAAAVTAVSALAVSTSNSVREQENFARVANMTVVEYQALSFAAKQYGLSVDQLSSASKDALERVGEYVNAQSGGLQDFADAMRMSKEEATKWAESMQGSSGIEVLQRMVSEMESAGVSADRMSHALEGMGSDLTFIMPLLAGGGDEARRLADKLEDVQVELSDEKRGNYKLLSENIDLLGSSFQSLVQNKLSGAAGELARVSDAVAHFFATLNEGSDAQAYSRMAELNEEIKELESDLKNTETAAGRLANVLTFSSTDSGYIESQIEAKRAELKRLREEIAGRQLTVNPYDTTVPVGGDKGLPSSGVSGGSGASLAAVEAARQLAESLRLQGETLQEAQDRELEILRGGNLSKEELLAAEFDLEEKYAKKRKELKERETRESDAFVKGVIDRGKTEEKVREEELERLNDYLTEGVITKAQFAEASVVIAKEAADKEAEIQNSLRALQASSQMAMIGGIQQGFAQMASIAEEGSALQKAMFVAAQGAAAANVWVSSEEAKWKLNSMSLTPAQLAANETLIEVKRGISLGLIGAQTVAGIMHDGGDVPDVNGRRESTWMLEGGERVLSRNSTSKMDKMYNAMMGGGGAGGGVTVQVVGNIYGDEETMRIISDAAKQGYQLVANDFRSNGYISRSSRR